MTRVAMRVKGVKLTAESMATPCAMRILPDGYDTGGDARKWDAGGAVCVGGKVTVQPHPE